MADESQDVGLPDAIRKTAANLGIDPYDLATTISYETGGKMSPDIWGGAGGKHLGLIQFSPENQQRYGVKPGMAPADHMSAVESYLRDRGVKPGMGLLDVYSAINAGRPGLYNRSDAANGGAPGTVADKVATMGPHRVRAQMVLDGKLPPGFTAPPATGMATASTPAERTGPAPMGLAPQDAGAAADPTLDALRSIAASAQSDQAQAPAPSIDMSMLAQHMARARALARMSMPNSGAAA